ncbi:MAG: amino acid ABC transporter ATP-binding protein [Lachnospiraceae bacterium]|nr:amino acid ABC transporter ATP-binding protein [Lachnospiraceae bacterium]
MLKIQNIKFSRGEKRILDGISTEIKDGEVVGIIGPSGTGKSTFLKMINLLIKPDEGEILVNDTALTESDVDTVREKIGMVFQNPVLFEHLTVIENAMIGMTEIKKLDKKAALEKAKKLLRMVGLEEEAYKYPKELSGGQRQRAAIVRTLSVDPEIILLDEPTSSLDPAMKGEVEAVIRILASAGHTMIMVSHEMELVRAICSRILFFNEGKIREEGTPSKIFDNPDNPDTRRFVNALKVLELTVESTRFNFLTFQNKIDDYAFRNGIPSELRYRLMAITEEFMSMLIILPEEECRMHFSLEYDRKGKKIEGEILFSGPPFDIDNPIYFISWPIIVFRATEISVEPAAGGQYTNRAKIVIEQGKQGKRMM